MILSSHLRFLAIIAMLGCLQSSQAQTSVLFDLGTNNTFRGLDSASPDTNGNFWNNVDNTNFFANVVDTTGTPTTFDFGFDGSLVGNTDSFNGPAGVTNSATLATDVLFTDIDQVALGDLGGSLEAAFDFYTSSRFQIQQLDPTKLYDLNFFGSHKFNTDNITEYRIYDDSAFSNLIASASLEVGVGSNHNRDTVATISNLPGPSNANNIFYVEFVGENGNNGYLNAFQLDEVGNVPPPTDILVTDFNNFNLAGTFDSWDSATITSGADSYQIQGTGTGGGFAFPGFPDASATNAIELDISLNSGDFPNVTALLEDGDGTQFKYRFGTVADGDHVLTLPLTPAGTTIGDNEVTNPVAGSTPGLDLTNLVALQIGVETGPTAAYDIEFNNLRLYAAAAVGGDYNGDGIVDAADYTVYRDNVGGDASVIFAEGTRDPSAAGVIGTDDYNFWVAQFGSMIGDAPAVSLATAAAVPEPGSVVLLLGATSLGIVCRRS